MTHKHSIRAAWIVLVIGLLVPWLGPQLDAQSVSDSKVEAAYMYSFAKFITWPEGTFATARDPIRLCILKDEPFQSQLSQMVKGKSIAGHPVLAVPIHNSDQARGCHELFISSADSPNTLQILESLQGASVLTIGDAKDFVQEGGILSFVLQGDHVRFQVNRKAANQAGLRLSSQLLSVAQAVIE